MVIEDLLEVEDDLCVSLLIPRVLQVRNLVQNVVMAKNILTEVLVVLMNIIICNTIILKRRNKKWKMQLKRIMNCCL